MKRILSLLLFLLPIVTVTEAAKPKKLTEKDMGAYLFTYFSDPTHALFMAISYDGYTFRPVNNGEPIISGDSIAEQHGIRDPHIYRAPNGKFYIAMTDLHIFGKQKGIRTTQWERPEAFGWGNNRGLVLMASDDLIHWTHHVARIDQLFPERFGEIGCAWAPQTIWDPEVGKSMVYFTIRQHAGGNTKVYYSSFMGQSTYVLTLSDEDISTLNPPLGRRTLARQEPSTLTSRIIFMADIWRPQHPRDARYIWLPIEFEDGKPVIRWRDEWKL